MRQKRHLTIEEKRDWLAEIFRDESGDVSHADKFKAMAEDTRLAMLEAEKKKKGEEAAGVDLAILDFLPPPLSAGDKTESSIYADSAAMSQSPTRTRRGGKELA